MTTLQSAVQVTRRPEKFLADDRRVITRFFSIGSERRIRAILDRVMALDETTVERLLAEVKQDFATRHREVEQSLERNFAEVQRYLDGQHELSQARRMLIGAYFTMEYSIAAAALFNPSIAPHPDQSGLRKGEQRFIMSLRATGEGHVSSIVFRTGVVTKDGQLRFDPLSQYASILRQREDRMYEKRLFKHKLMEMGAYDSGTRLVMEEMPEHFTLSQLDHKMQQIWERPDRPNLFDESRENMLWLAQSNYHLELPLQAEPSEIVIFPNTENETQGIEDLRLTHFVNDDGTVTYYGTFTAFNGHCVLPQMMATSAAWRTVEVHTLNGQYVQNKGMALFPRKINGLYYMISRLDGENMYLMKSDNPYFWNDAVLLKRPTWPWELVQIGNCGPPIETDQGWLVLTHGVGPMRQYSIGAILLDKDDPSRIVGELPEPLLAPTEQEREGYVPNVVYSCGSLLHGEILIIPYAMADKATSFASCNIHELLAALKNNGHHAA
jgi:predicted GH43/DUF377 family glycosyl hydrolase